MDLSNIKSIIFDLGNVLIDIDPSLTIDEIENLGGVSWNETENRAELENQIQRFIEYYNHERYHESINNLTPADVFYGRGQQVLDRRQQIKLNTMAMRKQMHYHNRTQNLNQMS